uniref:ADAM 17-like protease n=1 Tax=Strigamia maritima TaxID=126957 RepID=T1J977_STRMM
MHINVKQLILFLLCGKINCFIDATLKSLRYFETLHPSSLSHTIVKRGINPSPNKFNTVKQLSFKVLGRDFRLMLTPGTSVLSSKFQAYSIDGVGKKEYLSIDHETFYEGRIFGEKNSHASVHYEDGLLTASIQSQDDMYVIEPAWRHLDDNISMIAYKTSDMTDNEGEEVHKRTCGYIKVENNNVSREDQTDDEELVREKRQSDAYTFDSSRTRCPLLLVADYRFYQSMGGLSKKSTINYLISLIDRVHKIYHDTEWKDHARNKGFKGLGFVIEEIIIHNESTPVRAGQQHYNMDRNNWDVRDLLEVFSRESKHQRFCLAHLFTDIKFEGGILGLAYVGSSRRNSVGGICTPEYFKNGLTLYLNSGLSSSRNHYGQRVITREADLVTAHEFGHNWGSEHDPDNSDCSPDSSRGGSYLMYTYSVSGYDNNNKKFSPCSLRSIRAVLLAKSHKCFKEPQESFCGNSRVESGEECDVGLLSAGVEDLCCYRNCSLKSHSKCSDRNSPCCRDCNYSPSGVKCRDANPNTCDKETNCTGYMAECPKAAHEDDDTPCVDRGLCNKGECLPFCETKGRFSCMCDNIADACRRCCRLTLNSTCYVFDKNDILSDGTLCIHGFCNNGVCEKTVQDIVERFWDIIEDININSVIKFLNDNIVGTVIVISIVVWIPGSCLITYVDRKRRKEDKQRQEWFDKRNKSLIHSSDNHTKLIRVPRQRATGTLPSLSQPILGHSRPIDLRQSPFLR